MIIGIDGLRVTGNVEIEGNLVVKGSIESESKMKSPEFDGTAKVAITAYNIPTTDVGGNIWISEYN